ncbi:MAG: hypothetical protein K0R85_1024 [Devosia sp.]|jgi:hypothetical protein|nr:hypothetical protein [Devosia sp.]
MAKSLHPDSVLFVTLDSCRFDTFKRANLPNMKALGPLHRATAPSYFTFASHAAMFAGFTPGIAGLETPFLNPKFSKVFKMVGIGSRGKGPEAFQLEGRTIIAGFRNKGYATIGTGATGWFNPNTQTGRYLGDDFDHFFYPGDTYSLRRQLAWLQERLSEVADQPVFAFINVGETHVPYYHEGADWEVGDSPCVPFQKIDRSADCKHRQQACAEFVDRHIADLLAEFQHATIVLCADHGDCWGEDGLWEHGFSHEMTLTVPLIVRVSGAPIEAPPAKTESAGLGKWMAKLRPMNKA